MKDGVYLLALPGQDYGVPYVLKGQVNPDGSRFEILVGVDGVKLVSNLAPGYQLYYMPTLTPFRLAALKALITYAEVYGGAYEEIMIVQAMVDEAESSTE